MSEKLPYLHTKKRLWTIAEIEKLRDLYFAQVPVSEIASALNRTESSIISQARYRGFYRRQKPNRFPDFTLREPCPPHVLELVKEEWEKGTTREEIAVKIDRPLWIVRKLAKQLRLPPRRKMTLCLDDQQEIKNLFDAGFSARELGRKFKIDAGTVLKLVGPYKRAAARHFLSDTEKEIIEERYAEGCTSSCIAERISRGKATVNRYIRDMDLVRDEQDTDGTVAELLNHGLTVIQVGLKLSLPRLAIRAAIERNERAAK